MAPLEQKEPRSTLGFVKGFSKKPLYDIMGDLLNTEMGRKLFAALAKRSSKTPEFAKEILKTPGGKAALRNYITTPSNFPDILNRFTGRFRNNKNAQELSDVYSASLLFKQAGLPATITRRKKFIWGVVAGILGAQSYKSYNEHQAAKNKPWWERGKSWIQERI